MSLIPFNQASPVGNELGYIEEVLASGHIMGNGPYTRRCEALLESVTLSKRALLTTSCTSALEISALLLNLQPGDEIIVPSFAFVSTANAFVLHGPEPLLVDTGVVVDSDAYLALAAGRHTVVIEIDGGRREALAIA